MLKTKGFQSAMADYHGDFNAVTFEYYLSSHLIPAIRQKYGEQKVVIVMDNAPYHSR